MENSTLVSNTVFDVMGELRGSELRLLLAIARATWANGGEAELSYSELRTRSHIASDATIAKGLTTLLEAGHVERRPAHEKEPGKLEPAYCYILGPGLRIPTTVSVVGGGESVVGGDKTVVGAERHDQNCSDDDAAVNPLITSKPTEDPQVKDSRVGRDTSKQTRGRANLEGRIGINGRVLLRMMRDPLVTTALTESWAAWFEYGEFGSLNNPIGYAVKQMLAHEQPPNRHSRRYKLADGPASPETVAAFRSRKNDAFANKQAREKALAAEAATP